MKYKYAKYNSLINKITNKDLLFIGDYTLDPYQNCEFGCKYCDSALEKTTYIKINADKLLEKEIAKIKKGSIIVGSVNDPYQRIEKECKITRCLLRIIKEHDFPCHILTKSDLILRDIDILSKFSKCLVTISITLLDERKYKLFEENVPSPKKRLKVVEKLSESDIKVGLAIMPILPFIVEDELEEIVKAAKKYKADYILYKHLELKGDQKTVFLKEIGKINPSLLDKYKKLYKDNYIPNQGYILNIGDILEQYCVKYNLRNRV